MSLIFFFLKIFFNSIKKKTLEGYNLDLAARRLQLFMYNDTEGRVYGSR